VILKLLKGTGAVETVNVVSINMNGPLVLKLFVQFAFNQKKKQYDIAIYIYILIIFSNFNYLVPEEYGHWLDATFYEVLIPAQLTIRAAILNVTLTLRSRSFQSDDEDEFTFSSGSGSGLGSGSGTMSEITFHLETDYPFFKFENGDTTHTALNDKDNVASITETCTIVVTTSNLIPLGDYEMQVIATTREDDVSQRSGIIVHVVEPPPSHLPAPG